MDFREALSLYELPLSALAAQADGKRRDTVGDRIELCTIINAKSGCCPEDCKWCAQSAHSKTGVPEYDLVSLEEMVEGARRAKAIGSGHFGIVTSGRALDDHEVDAVIRAVKAIRSDVAIEVCASLGCLEKPQLRRLAEAGLARYHHNIETSPAYFPRLVTTHAFEDRVQTIRNAAEAGLRVCSGGIIGMGESREDRVSMALILRDLPVVSICVNILMPIAGTPLEGASPMSVAEILKTIAILRIVMPDRTIKLCAGRETSLADFQGAAFMTGANSMMIGGYLTQRGRSVEEDQRLVREILSAWMR